MEGESLQDRRQSILERWSRVFDNSFAPAFTKTLQKVEKHSSSDVLELEDVNEEVQDEVVPRVRGCHHMGNPNPMPLAKRPVQMKKSLEQVTPKPPGRTRLTAEKPVVRTRTEPAKATIVSPKSQPLTENIVQGVDVTPQSASSTGRPPSGKVRARKKTNTPPQSAKQVKPAMPVKPVIPGGSPITLDMTKSLRVVLFGSTHTSFNMDWRKQHINFSTNLSYGLSFYTPGPAGVMACVQAFLMKNLLYSRSNSLEMVQSLLQPMASDRQMALVSAMAQMMWQAGDKKQAVVALPCGECQWLSYKDYRPDHLTEKLVLFEFSAVDELEKFIKRQLSFFESTGGDGCVLLLYSVILSRTTTRVCEDLSEPNTTLMASHDACSQAMVNLLLTGRATRNVFNGDVEYNRSGTLLPYPQKGVKGRNDIGFLSLWEYLDSKQVEVGSMLKTPKFPVWVVDSTGGRYGVVFCLNKELVNDWRLERRFDLYYYNGTTKLSAATGDVITVDTRDIVEDLEVAEDTHPVANCLRTKWPGAVIEWN